MDNYIVSARKYRPTTFRSVVGQNALTSTLKNAIATGRLAHSYLFCGSRGVGKTSCARIMAKTINCEHRTADGEACNECASCRAFNAGTSLNIIELDAASNNGVDQMRALIEQVLIPPADGRYRVFIIDEVHMLSPGAFNAFLKTLEEPPSYVVFILATTEKHKILPTILSRCQIYDFSRITIQDMIDHMSYVAEQEGITAERSALNIIARKADGAMRDALSIFDQVAASTRGNITYRETLDNLNVLDYEYYNRLIEAFLKGDVMASWLIYKEIRERGFDSQFFINGLAAYFRDLAVARDPSTISLLEAADDTKAAMAAIAAKCSPDFLLRALSLCNDADLNYRLSSSKQLLVELTLAKICQLCSPSPVTDGKAQGLKKIAVAREPSTGQTAQASAAGAPTPAPLPGAQASAQAPAPTTQASATSAQTQAQAPAATPAQSQSAYSAPAASQPHIAREPQAAAPAGRPFGRTGRPSLRALTDQGVGQGATAPAAQKADEPKAAAPYTYEALLQAWEQYAASHPTEKIMINTMRTALPQATEVEHRYLVTVENELQQELMRERMSDILASIHTALSNSLINVDVAINQGPPSPLTWTQYKVLEYMQEKNPELREFVKTLKLTFN